MSFSLKISKHENIVEGGVLLVYIEIENNVLLWIF